MLRGGIFPGREPERIAENQSKASAVFPNGGAATQFFMGFNLDKAAAFPCRR
jgi:hypothetical protein